MPNIKVQKVHHFSGHQNSVYSIIPGPLADTVISSGGDGVVVQWDINAEKEPKAIANVKTQVFSLLYIKKYGYLIIGQMQGGIHVIDLLQNKEIKFITTHTASIYDLKWDIDNNRLLAVSGDGHISIWSLPEMQLVKNMKLSGQNLRSIAFHPQREVVAIGCSSDYIHLLNSNTHEVLHQFKAHENSVFSLLYSKDGKYLFSGSRDAHLKVWNVEKNYELWHAIPAHRFTINDLCLISGGKYIASAGRDKDIRIWDTESFQLLKVINNEKQKGHVHSVNKLLWLEEQQLLVSCSDDRNIMVWKIQDQA